MPQHSVGDVGDLDVQSNSCLVAEGKGLVWLRITQQADLGVAVRLELTKGELFTCRTMQDTVTKSMVPSDYDNESESLPYIAVN